MLLIREEVSTITEKYIPVKEPKAYKVEQVTVLQELLDRSAAVLLTDYRGLTVAEKTELTRKLREVNAEYHVVKNTLFRRAYADRGDDVSPLLEGPTAVVFALDDPVTPAKTLLDFIREKKKVEVKGAVVDGKLYDTEQVTALSKLPTKDQLRAQLIATIQGPLSEVVRTLQAPHGELVRTLQAFVDKQQAGSVEAA